jgi:hypothetical protein
LREEHGVPHYTLIPDLYGAGPGVLQQALGSIIAREDVREIVVDTRMRETADCLAMLVAMARTVIRKF